MNTIWLMDAGTGASEDEEEPEDLLPPQPTSSIPKKITTLTKIDVLARDIPSSCTNK